MHFKLRTGACVQNRLPVAIGFLSFLNPNILGFSVRNVPHITPLAPTILRWFMYSWKNLSISRFEKLIMYVWIWMKVDRNCRPLQCKVLALWWSCQSAVFPCYADHDRCMLVIRALRKETTHAKCENLHAKW